MILVCTVCLKAVILQAPFEPEESARLKGLQDEFGEWPCVVDGCEGRAVNHPVLAQAVRESPEKYRAEQFTATEFFQAVHGFGSPKEKYLASPEQVQDILLGAQIRGLRMRRAGSPDRTVLERITVEAYGVKLDIHLAAGGRGATIYKVTDHVGQRGDGGGPAPREQGGQPLQPLRGDEPAGGDAAPDSDESAGDVPGLRTATEVRE